MMIMSKLHRRLVKEDGYKFTRYYLDGLVKQGKIPYKIVDGRKQYKYKHVVVALLNIKQKADTTIPEFNVKDENGELKTLNSTKVMLQDYQARTAKVKLEVISGEKVSREDVERKAYEVARVLRNQLLTLPERITAEIMGAKDLNEAKELFYKELNDILSYLSDGKKLYD